MPNIGALLKQEIARVSRKELRSQVEPLRKAATQSRRRDTAFRQQVAALERELAQVQRQLAQVQRQLKESPGAADAGPGKIRFVAKGLKSHRSRLGLSAADYGRLVGVSAQSIYNWEQGHANPRPEQVAAIAALRHVRKREAARRLEELGAAPAA